MISIKKYETIRSLYLSDDLPQSREVISVESIFIELHDYLGIRLRLETISFLDELIFEFAIVFYDTVVDDDKSPRLRKMWMTVFFGDSTVRSPPSVTDTDMVRCEIIGLSFDLETADFPY